MKAVKTAQWVRFSEQFPPVHTRKETSESIATPKGQAKVILFKCNQKVAEHNLGKKLFSLGRAPTNTLTLRRPTVSRRHACLTILNNQVWIKNIGETNSTYVNAKSIKNIPLSDGDIIRVSDFLLLFIYESNDSTRVETIPTTAVLSTEEKSNERSEPTHQETHKTSENLDSSETVVEPLLTEFTTQQASNKKSDTARIEAIPATPTLSTKEKNNNPSGATLQEAHKNLENLDNSETIVEPAPIKQASNKENDPTGIEATPTTATLSAIENRNKWSDATHQEVHKNQDSLDDSKAAEKPTLNELHTSKQASNTQKNRAMSVVERRHRKEREHNKRRFVLMAGGVAALFGPMLAVILFFNLAGNKSTPTIEIPAKLEKTPIQNHSLSAEAASPLQQQGSIAHNDSATASPESTMESNDATDNKQLSESVVGDNKLQELITQARQHIRNDEFSQSLNLIIEGTKLDPNSHELASLQAESIEKLEKKEQEWRKDK
jgi:pSer/pThr/pTyr-binding forkhead associated (FHA) protein